MVWAEAAAMGAVPRPDSLENRPRATPYLQAIIMAEPRKPPATDWRENAEVTMVYRAGSRKWRFKNRIHAAPTI